VPDLAANWAFDRYSDNIREASVFFMKTGPSTATWSIELFKFERTVLQFGSDGGPRVVHGVSRPDAAIFMLQIAKTEREVLFDGHTLRWHDMAVLAPGSHFTFASNAPAQWIALSVANDLMGVLLHTLEIDGPILLRNLAISLAPELAWRFAKNAKKTRSLLQRSGSGADLSVIEETLLAGLKDLLRHPDTKLFERQPRTLATETTISLALEYVRSRSNDNIYVGDIAGVAGVNVRALYRCFQNYLALSPKDYLKYRQLNLVRRALRLDTGVVGTPNPVTLVSSKHGVSEFGRFAVEYKRLFKETPSQTLARRHKVDHLSASTNAPILHSLKSANSPIAQR
jgi:AraC family transcriptional regulator, ethanolamine operon transcriptional activator